MKVLIIGGTGCISTAITRELLERGDDVTLFNRGKTAALFPPGTKQIVGNRKDYAAFEQQVTEAGLFDAVIEMICFLPDDAQSLIRAIKGRTGQLIFCSTIEVYSKPADRYPIFEGDSRHSNSSYGINKAICEDLLLEAHQRGEFKLTTIRPAYTYGEGGMLLNPLGSETYIDRIAKQKPIVVPGDGSSLWVACHRDDVGRAFVAALGNPRVYGKTYNTTGEVWMTWDECHQGVAKASGVPGPTLVHIPTDLLRRLPAKRGRPMPEIFNNNYIYDNSAAKADLDFHYTIPWVEGARRTIAWLQEHGRIKNSDEDPFEDQIIAAWERLERHFLEGLAGEKP